LAFTCEPVLTNRVDGAADALTELLKAVERPHPRPGDVGTKAANAARCLADLRAALAGLDDIRAADFTVRALKRVGVAGPPPDWESGCQAYLAAAAVERARVGLRPGTRTDMEFSAAYEALRSPQGFRPVGRDRLHALLSALPGSWPPK
jgi:hypothetical protein